ncbi:MAG: DUF2973 domain-containing protein [Pseudanabaena sp.]|jgi:hypothetical protein|nr:DUF2973 domain-containing protein [Pseudanabaena sp. M53BS1SP1A06MG]MCA6581390.1 DUF2973 domain-containing protein [Pseudanabaena sp. M34BS1SP1A06MG]MCA6586582.1 DUF2973 domain-containing protein [Pseudanabaena sp. M051S1SP1A06QC]MCA6594220.1 DUF2973 domain-containing protein [Pseudanabaena sp. M38BS1SP1A06MG]MCA6596750.1 DUF2973 domain-containing protein [Pseudanabaena sp. M046S1SP1A06QC]MCA6601704.1 DUF2973 domain-containing protein [Pseudanabaena sp. M57BS1SP1A06MG]MCA6603335.1 DUF2973 
MVQIIYILAFTILSIFAISNLIRSMISLSQNDSRSYQDNRRRVSPQFTHPELWDKDGKYIDEPLMVIKSINVDDARSRLDALYNSSPNGEKS